MVLRQQSKDRRCRTGGKVVEGIQGERTDEEGQEEGWKESCVGECR